MPEMVKIYLNMLEVDKTLVQYYNLMLGLGW